MARLISLKKENAGEVILAVLLVIYLIMGYNTPQPVAELIDSLIGKILLFIIIAYMFLNCNAVLAVLFLFVTFDLIRRSSSSSQMTSTVAKKYQPSEKNKSAQFTALNQFPYTLEQEVITKMVPTFNPGNSLSTPSYKPILEDLHDASHLGSGN